MKTLLILALTLTSLSAFANTTVCTDATGQLQYIHEGYNKGMPPRDGDQTDSIQVTFRGVLQSESKAFKNKEAELGPINPDFSQIKVLKQGSSSNGTLKIFSAKLVLSKNKSYKGSEEPNLQLPLTTYMICQDTFLAVP